MKNYLKIRLEEWEGGYVVYQVLEQSELPEISEGLVRSIGSPLFVDNIIYLRGNYKNDDFSVTSSKYFTKQEILDTITNFIQARAKNIEPEYGERVLVKDKDMPNWCDRIFLAKGKDKIITVCNNDESSFNRNEQEIIVTLWDEMKPKGILYSFTEVEPNIYLWEWEE